MGICIKVLPPSVKIIMNLKLAIGREIRELVFDPDLKGFILGESVRYEATFHGCGIGVRRHIPFEDIL